MEWNESKKFESRNMYNVCIRKSGKEICLGRVGRSFCDSVPVAVAVCVCVRLSEMRSISVAIKDNAVNIK